MKTTHILSRSLCIYDRQVTQILTRGWGGLGTARADGANGGVARVCARAYIAGACVCVYVRERETALLSLILLAIALAWSLCLSRSRQCRVPCVLHGRQ